MYLEAVEYLEAASEDEVVLVVAQDHHLLGAGAALAAVSQRSQLVQGARSIKSL